MRSQSPIFSSLVVHEPLALIHRKGKLMEQSNRADTPAQAKVPRQETPALEVENLSYGYTARDLVFDSVDFELYAGEVAFLTGPNGAGKSTLFRCVRGWMPPRPARSPFGQEAAAGRRAHARRQPPTFLLINDVPSFYDGHDRPRAHRLGHTRQQRRRGYSKSESRPLSKTSA